MNYSPRSIIYEPACNSILDRVIEEYGDDAIIALEWSLARKPEEWFQIPGTDVYMARTNFPTVHMYFTANSQFVTILRVDAEF